jgi:hypothetical protein
MYDSGGGGGGASSEAIALFPYAEEEELAASPATISTLADGIQTSGGNLEVLGPNVEGTYRPAVTGTADVLQTALANSTIKKTTTDNMSEVLAATLCASGATRLFGTDGVQAYNTKMDGLRSEYDSEKARIMASNCGVADATYPEGATAAEKTTIDNNHAEDVAAAQESALSGVRTRLLKLKKGYVDDPLNAEATTAKTRLNQGPTVEVMQALYSGGGLPLSSVEALPSYHLEDVPLNEWPPELANATDEEKANWLFAHPELGSTLAINASDNVQRLVGEKIADEVRTLDEESSSEDYRRVAELLQTWQDASLGVTAEMYKALGPEDALDLIGDLGEAMTAYGEVDHETGRTFASTFQRGLELATAMWDDQEAYNYGQGLVQALDGQEDDYGPNHRAAALSYLLYDGHYSTGFLGGVGEELDHYEREENRGTVGLWGGRDGGALSQLFPEDMRNDDSYTDPMASFFTSLENNPEAALNFFTGGDGNRAYDESADFNEEEMKARQEYYLKDRIYYDNFESLFGSLEQATLDDINVDNPERAKLAAGLVSSIAEYVPDREGLESGDDFLQVSEKATVSLAHILSGYMDSVAAGIENPEAPGERGSGLAFAAEGDGAFRALFETSELKSLIKLTVSTDDGVNAMRYGVSAYEQLALNRDMQTHGELTEAALNNDARVEAFFTDCVGEQKISDAEEADQRRAAWINMGKDLVGVIPLPGAEVVGQFGSKGIEFLVSQSTNAAGDGFEKAYANSADKAVAEGNEAADRALEDRQIAIATAMYEPGGEHANLISHSDLASAASGYSDAQVEEWFGTADNPKMPSGEEIAAMSQDERDQYENVLKDALSANSPTFANGTYQTTYRATFIDYQQK